MGAWPDRTCRHASCTAALSGLRDDGKILRGKVVVAKRGEVKCGHGCVKAQEREGVLLGQVARLGRDHGVKRVHAVCVDDVRFASVVVRPTALLVGRPASVGLLGCVRLNLWPRL